MNKKRVELLCREVVEVKGGKPHVSEQAANHRRALAGARQPERSSDLVRDVRALRTSRVVLEALGQLQATPGRRRRMASADQLDLNTRSDLNVCAKK